MKKHSSGQCDRNTSSQCCSVRAVVTVDERGQMVLPKDLRKELGITAGEKLAVIAMGGADGRKCCLTLMKLDQLSDAVKITLGPVLGEITKTGMSQK